MIDLLNWPGDGREMIIDSFAGGGGASEGIRIALGRDPDAALNHDPVALAMHKANHPGTKHYCQDIWQASPNHVTGGRPVGLLWASPDCKHFSKAKGGAPTRDSKIRDMAWAVVRWAEEARPRIIILENVEEFTTWGPLDVAGRVIKAQSGATFRAWLRRLKRLGYRVQWRELRACDYGAPTIRKRLFLVARCDGLPIVWPEPTHGPGREKPWRTAAECIDWSVPCPSIFERKRPLAENTLRRIAEGLRRYVLTAKKPFVVTYYGPKREGDFRGQDLGDPLRTQTTENRHALVAPSLAYMQRSYKGHGFHGTAAPDKPMPTITATPKGGGFALVAPHLMVNTSGHAGADARGPVPTVTTGNHHYAVTAFMAKHYGGVVGHGLGQPLGTVTTVDHHGLVAAHIQRDFGNSVGHAASAPCGTITPGGGGKEALVTSNLLKLKGTSRAGQRTDEPLHTVQAGGLHYGEVRALLIKYFGQGVGQDVADPLHTVTSKDRFGLVTVMIEGEPYAIADIGMRMLQPRELFRAQGFPDSYIIDPEYNGKPLTKAAQVRCCGNSVCPPLAAALVRANYVEQETRRVG